MTTPTDISSIARCPASRRTVVGVVAATSVLTLLAASAHAVGVMSPTAPLWAGAVCLVTGILAVVVTGPVEVPERRTPRSDTPTHPA